MASDRSTGTAWIIPGLAAVAAVSWAAWATIAAVRATVVSPTASPVDQPAALQQELLRQNVHRSGDPGLGALYADISARYYHGALPATPVRWEPRMADVGKLADDRFTLEGMFGHVGHDTVILLNPALQNSHEAVARALCHEIVHAYLFAIGDDSTDHGPAFQVELRRLAVAGAFAGMPASEADRATLHAWLDTEATRLDAEHEALDRVGADLASERGDIERAVANVSAPASAEAAPPPGADVLAALTARRDAYNQEAVEARERTDRYRVDLERFNHEVARYNLMLVYPDGLDEAALLHPRAGGT
jgi:hypothetical protein